MATQNITFNIKHVWVGLTEDTPSKRRIYIEGEKPLTEQQECEIKGLGSKIGSSLHVWRKAKDQNFEIDEGINFILLLLYIATWLYNFTVYSCRD